MIASNRKYNFKEMRKKVSKNFDLLKKIEKVFKIEKVKQKKTPLFPELNCSKCKKYICVFYPLEKAISKMYIMRKMLICKSFIF